jgi:Flp pilus assembly protein TadB
MLPKEERTISQLFSELSKETTDLVRQEVQLAKAETSEKISQAGKGIGMLAAGALVAFCGLLVLVAMLVIVLNGFMQTWLAALIVGALVIIIGMALLQKGRNELKARNLMPRRTAESLRRDGQLVKEHRHGISRAQQHST